MTEAITLHIDGMTCGSCAEHVKQTLEKVPGVRSASVSYPQRRAEIEASVGTAADVTSLVAAVSALGYRAQLADAPGQPSDLLNNAQERLGGEPKREDDEAALHVAVIGSGGAAMAAALKAVEQGARVTQ
jgi:mercuric reductase